MTYKKDQYCPVTNLVTYISVTTKQTGTICLGSIHPLFKIDLKAHYVIELIPDIINVTKNLRLNSCFSYSSIDLMRNHIQCLLLKKIFSWRLISVKYGYR